MKTILLSAVFAVIFAGCANAPQLNCDREIPVWDKYNDYNICAKSEPNKIYNKKPVDHIVEIPDTIADNEDKDKGHGNDPDKSDPDNPGKSEDKDNSQPKDDNGHGNDPGKHDPSNPGKKYLK